MTNSLEVTVEALDSGFGYKVRATAFIATESPQRETLTEHYGTEAEVATRLGTIWTWWASRVDSE